MGEVGGVEHDPIAYADAGDLLLGGIATRLIDGPLHGPPVPGQGAGPPHLYQEVFSPQATEEEVREVRLMIQIRQLPAQDTREQVLQDVLGDLLRGAAVPLLLRQAPAPTVQKGRPALVDPFEAVTTRGKGFDRD